MNPQRPSSYPYPEDDFTRIDMTWAEDEAIRAGEATRLAAWEAWKGKATERAEEAAERARVLQPQVAEIVRELQKRREEEEERQRNLRIEQELNRCGEDASVLGTRFPRDTEYLEQWVPGIAEVEDSLAQLEPGEFEHEPGYAVRGPLAAPQNWKPDGYPSVMVPPSTEQKQEVVAALPTRAGGFSGGNSVFAYFNLAQTQDDLRKTQESQTAAGREQTRVALESSAAFTDAAGGMDAFGTSAEISTVPVQRLTNDTAELGGQFGGFNAVVEATPAHIAEVNAAFDATAQDQLPELIGQMGALEYQTLAAVDAFSQLAGAPRGSPPAGGMSGGRRSAGSPRMPDPEYLNTPAPANLQEIYLDQFKQGHDMSGFHNAEHWWEKHLEHVAQRKAAGHAFAQGTRYAPGGMALVGEMGPELVNLPRGSR